ncbi:DUF982 domain-containing protein [Mesorhizobium sp. ESP-6-4]|nr:DUF982 domain-containing protein [Mesorhizobium sp. ESP-6-4]
MAQAAEVISEALYGRKTPEKARAAFVDAAREAGVLMGDDG